MINVIDLLSIYLLVICICSMKFLFVLFTNVSTDRFVFLTVVVLYT